MPDRTGHLLLAVLLLAGCSAEKEGGETRHADVAEHAPAVHVEADRRADDAVAAFSQLCISLFTGGTSAADPARFEVAKLPPEVVREIKPALAGQTVWDVSGRRSGVRMLVHYEPSGLCVVEVAEADPRELQARFTAAVDSLARSAGRAEPQPAVTKDVDGVRIATAMWRVPGPDRPFLLALTTAPVARFMVQHVMTASYVR